MQKQQYLQGLLQHACKDTNIYKGSCEFEIWNLRDEIAMSGKWDGSRAVLQGLSEFRNSDI